MQTTEQGQKSTDSPAAPVPLWGSQRLIYTICAFICFVMHLCMRNALNFAILCMVKPDRTAESISVRALSERKDCGILKSSIEETHRQTAAS